MRVPTAARAALVPVAASALTLAGLSAWAGSGAAGSPSEPVVTRARVLLPANPDTTAAFFDIRNQGGADDELVEVSSPAAGRAMLSRVEVRDGAGTMRMVPSVRLPAGGTLRMSTAGVDVMVDDPPSVRVGDRMPFVLRFRDAGPVRVEAVVVRPGDL
ncbi:copper chaperone PCu(A)C [Streptomyces pactum]|uniref:copper chaperone PCu(A)C n=1 Tax=Streptomyces pactum TaxID=68249 RepID=UPI0037031497